MTGEKRRKKGKGAQGPVLLLGKKGEASIDRPSNRVGREKGKKHTHRF